MLKSQLKQVSLSSPVSLRVGRFPLPSALGPVQRCADMQMNSAPFGGSYSVVKT